MLTKPAETVHPQTGGERRQFPLIVMRIPVILI
jgi:hypothetical protein